MSTLKASGDHTPSLLSSRLLHLVLLPTEQCNFRCVYCYEDFDRSEMTPEVVQSIEGLIRRRLERLDLLAVEWFGGEPLLAWPVVEHLQAFACEQTRRQPGLRFHAAMTTNASLLDRRRFERLLELKLRSFQVTLDGEPADHDRTRRRRGGGGSFEAIWRNLLAMRDCDRSFKVDLRLHLTPKNLDSQKRLLGRLSDAFGGDSRFSVLYKAIRHFGGPNDAGIAVLCDEHEDRVLAEFYDRAEALGLATVRDPLSLPGVLPGCYAAAAGSYVVRSDGELAKCTVSLRHPNNRVGRLLPDGRVQLDSAKMLGWIRGSLNGDRASQECPAAGFAPPVQTLVTLGSGRAAVKVRAVGSTPVS